MCFDKISATSVAFFGMLSIWY